MGNKDRHKACFLNVWVIHTSNASFCNRTVYWFRRTNLLWLKILLDDRIHWNDCTLGVEVLQVTAIAVLNAVDSNSTQDSWNYFYEFRVNFVSIKSRVEKYSATQFIDSNAGVIKKKLRPCSKFIIVGINCYELKSIQFEN